MMTNLYPLIFAAALRALVAAVAVWAGIRMLRVANVVVLKTVWAIVLVAALFLPLAPSWMSTPPWLALTLPAMPAIIPGPAINPANEIAIRSQAATAVQTQPAEIQLNSERQNNPERNVDRKSVSAAPISSPSINDSHFASAPVADAAAAPDTLDDSTAAGSLGEKLDSVPPPAVQESATVPAPVAASNPANPLAARIALFTAIAYFGVTAALVLRLLLGLISAVLLWIGAKPISILKDASWNVRSSKRVSSPVNIGSGIVLPAEYSEWDEEKLRIVLAHERAHIRQGDFYLQLMAGLYASIFWFSPLGWWLKRKLYELGEAISDRAGLEEAASRASYAQLLLEFAALPRPTLTGVAMARTSHLSQRIERLLNESSFRQAFAASRRRALLALVLVPISIVTATSLVTVQAARPSTQSQPAVVTGQSTPEQVTDAAPQAAPAPVPDSQDAQPAPSAVPAPPAAPSPDVVAVPAPPAPGAPADVDGDHVIVVPQVHINPHIMHMPQIAAIPPMPPMPPDAFGFRARDFAMAYGFGQDGDPYALVGGDGKVKRPNGWFFNDSDRDAEIDKARKQAHGAFLWFQHEGKSYMIEDPSVIEQIDAMNKPMDDLQNQMRDLGKQMRELGEQQREKAKAMRDTAVQTPDLSKELAELKAAEDALRAKQGSTITQKEVGDLQREIGRIQGELGSLQGRLAVDQSGFGKAMGEFGVQQGKLGGEMGKLGSEMGRIARENHQKIDQIIKDSLSNGKAKQVQ